MASPTFSPDEESKDWGSKKRGKGKGKRGKDDGKGGGSTHESKWEMKGSLHEPLA
jgi:hypothetical protein